MQQRATEEPVASASRATEVGREELVQLLLSWYRGARRELPWRQTRDPYAIWISEIMLQQTRVETVVPYYERFLERFPTVSALADAEQEQVLTYWSGLGYYRRARQLHLAAQEVVEQYGGQLPDRAAELKKLKGIGPYTAGAIASIAFGEAAPLVDGNVARVLARLFALPDDMKSPRGMKRAWQLAEQLVPAKDAGDYNQALMELGATVCVPREPRCLLCPLRAQCQGRAQGLERQLPNMSRKVKPKRRELVCAVLHAPRGMVLMAQRHADGLFGGLWEPPMVEAASLEQARAGLSQLGVSERRELSVVGQVRHVLTHRRLEILVAAAKVGRRSRPPQLSEGDYAELRWTEPAEVPLSTLARKLLKAAAKLPLVLLVATLLLCSTQARADEGGNKSEAKPQPAKPQPAKPQPAKTQAEPAQSEDTAAAAADDGDAELSANDMRIYRALSEPGGIYARLLTSLTFGQGLRFNNPYRLQTILGDGPESVSLTAPYMDIGAGLAFGPPDGIQHGGMLRLSVALDGVPQEAFSFSYMALYRADTPWLLYGRLGGSLLTRPQSNVGIELGVGAAYFLTGGFGLTADLVGNLFYGAGTYEVQFSVVPILSMSAGIMVDYEVLP